MLVGCPFDIALLARSRRLQMKLRQVDVARATGVSRAWIVDLEHGKTTLEVGHVMRALGVLGIEISLWHDRDAPKWAAPLEAAALAAQTRRALPRRRPKVARRSPKPPADWGR